MTVKENYNPVTFREFKAPSFWILSNLRIREGRRKCIMLWAKLQKKLLVALDALVTIMRDDDVSWACRLTLLTEWKQISYSTGYIKYMVKLQNWIDLISVHNIYTKVCMTLFVTPTELQLKYNIWGFCFKHLLQTVQSY